MRYTQILFPILRSLKPETLYLISVRTAILILRCQIANHVARSAFRFCSRIVFTGNSLNKIHLFRVYP